MSGQQDPFRYHPELRGEIVDPATSAIRSFSIEKLAKISKEIGQTEIWWHSDETRESLRRSALNDHGDRDLWVFGYGSLMWDPAFHFAEVRRAHVAGYSRRFILKDIHGARGTRAQPGLMAALDLGSGCDGLAFRIAAENLEEETKIIWRREQVGPAYISRFVDTNLSDCQVRAVTFVADHDAEAIEADMTRSEQIRFLATGTGFLGTSIDYLRNIDSKFNALGIEDEDVISLLQETEAYQRQHKATSPAR
ncbi:MAG: gamma-glutamylcyclotransferase [Rhizobiaceae bacterium]